MRSTPFDSDRRHRTITVEMDVVLEERGVPVVGLDAEESAVDGGGDGAGYGEVVDGALKAGGTVHGGEDGGARELDGVGAAEAVGGVGWAGGEGGEEVVDVGHVEMGRM